MDTTIKLQGTHGTSQRNAAGACLHGFNLSLGRVGKGAYFWAQCELAEHLAKGWFKFQHHINAYREYPNALEAVIKADLECLELEHINLEELYFKDKLQSLVVKHKVQNLDTDTEIAKLHSLVVSEVEQASGHKCRIMEVRLAPPPANFVPDYSIRMYGSPICYVVRDPVCITIKQVV